MDLGGSIHIGTSKIIVDFQIFPPTCCLQTKYADYKGQVLLLSRLIGQAGTCMDKMCLNKMTKNLPHFQNLKLTTVSFRRLMTER